MSVRSCLPLALTVMRLLLAPVLAAGALFAPAPGLFGLCLTLGFLSDVFDGIIARRLGVATPGLRRLDSAVDTVFYLAAGFAAWHLHPQVIARCSGALLMLGALELGRYLLDFAKFGREASYHMWSSKAWGLALFVSFIALLVLGYTGPWVATPVYLGIVADVEGLAISLLLSHWQSDVPSLFHAMRLRSVARA